MVLVPNPPDWTVEQRRCLLFAGQLFTAPAFGYTYQWRAETWIGARNNDHKPFLMAKPVRRLPGGTKTGGLRRMHVFHAQELPEKPD